MKNIIYTLICLTILYSPQINAEDKEIKPLFSGKVDVDYLRSKGNVDKSAIGYGFLLEFKRITNEVSFMIEGNRGKIQDITYTDEIKASVLNTYHLNENSTLYGKITYYENELRGYKYQKRIGGGYLHTLYQNNLNKLEEEYFKTRIGYQNRNNLYTTNINDHQDYLQVGFRFKYPLMKNISLFTEFNYMVDFSDSTDYEIENLLAFIFTVNEKIDVEIEYERLYLNIPVFEKEKTDSSFKTKLTYKF
ncbi:MAG: DUF481 domain-containing protein [Candidatus Marithrix sp.]|nr:DUF481 domain-containing protein [Candidatus Marithrix sp.]